MRFQQEHQSVHTNQYDWPGIKGLHTLILGQPPRWPALPPPSLPDTTLPLYGLNTLLERQGYYIHPVKVRDARRFVACTDKYGRVERYGLFELRRTTGEERNA